MITILELVAALNKAALYSKLGQDTVVVICESEREYLDIAEVKLDQDKDGALVLIIMDETQGK